MHGDDVVLLENPAAAGFDLPVHSHVAALGQQFGVTPCHRRARELQERTQRDWTSDVNVVQLLSLIGMMR
jgi:hypothetical protein